MAYLGVQPTAGQYRKLDDISASFNGSTTTFTTQVGGQNVTAGSAQSILVSLGGVIQSPGTNYSVSANSITFATAPASGLSFFAILLGEAVNTGTPSDGTVTPAKLSTGGPSWNSTGNVVLQTAGTTAAPALQPTGDTNTGIYFPAADTIGFVEDGTEAMRIDSSGRLLVGTSTAVATSMGFIQQGSAGIASASANILLAKNTTSVSNGASLGTIYFSDSSQDLAAYIDCARDGGTWTSGSSQPTRLVFGTTADGASSPTEHVKIDKNGGFYSYTTYSNTSASAANVGVAGSGVFFRSTSSAKYKTNIETIQDSYSDALLQCRPVWYRSICDLDCPEHSFWGFIAEEVAAIDPRLVHWKTVEITYDENGSAVETPCDPEPEGVAYDRFVPHLLNLIKRQKEQIDAMDARLAALEAS